jgi:hypothetical protein
VGGQYHQPPYLFVAGGVSRGVRRRALFLSFLWILMPFDRPLVGSPIQDGLSSWTNFIASEGDLKTWIVKWPRYGKPRDGFYLFIRVGVTGLRGCCQVHKLPRKILRGHIRGKACAVLGVGGAGRGVWPWRQGRMALRTT